MTGHGGNDFLKFQDFEELGAQDLADGFAQMFEKQRYNEILFMIDTCQAASMYKRISSPNIMAAASSAVGQSSYSHHSDSDIGVTVVDRWTYYNLQTLEKVKRGDTATMQDLVYFLYDCNLFQTDSWVKFDTYDERQIASTPGIFTEMFQKSPSETLITDFFGGVQTIELTTKPKEQPLPLSNYSDYKRKVQFATRQSDFVMTEAVKRPTTLHYAQHSIVFDLSPANPSSSFTTLLFVFLVLSCVLNYKIK